MENNKSFLDYLKDELESDYSKEIQEVNDSIRAFKKRLMDEEAQRLCELTKDAMLLAVRMGDFKEIDGKKEILVRVKLPKASNKAYYVELNEQCELVNHPMLNDELKDICNRTEQIPKRARKNGEIEELIVYSSPYFPDLKTHIGLDLCVEPVQSPVESKKLLLSFEYSYLIRYTFRLSDSLKDFLGLVKNSLGKEGIELISYVAEYGNGKEFEYDNFDKEQIYEKKSKVSYLRALSFADGYILARVTL